MKASRGFALLPLLLAVLGFLVVSGGAYWYVHQDRSLRVDTISPGNSAYIAAVPTSGASPLQVAFTFKNLEENGSYALDTGDEKGAQFVIKNGLACISDAGAQVCKPEITHTFVAGSGPYGASTFTVRLYAYDDAQKSYAKEIPGEVMISLASVDTTQTHTDGVSVPGMSKYTDSDFGFSFWYPSGWKVEIHGASFVLVDEKGNYTDLGIEELSPPDGRLLLPGSACGPADGCADMVYYFDASLHTWMVQYPNGYAGEGGSAAPGTTRALDVSRNTMGGLHMLGGNLRFGLGTVVPLSAHNFLFISGAPGGFGGGQAGIQDFLAKTIVATDPAVATPVSAAEQINIIQAEKDAYAKVDTIAPHISISTTTIPLENYYLTITGANLDPLGAYAGNGWISSSHVFVYLANTAGQTGILWEGGSQGGLAVEGNTITVAMHPSVCMVSTVGTGGCPDGQSITVVPGNYTLSVSVTGRGTSNTIPITIAPRQSTGMGGGK